MGTLWQDLKFGARMLPKRPGFTAAVVLTLALGIGANTAIFSVVYGVLLRPLPYPQPDRIVSILWSYKGQPEGAFDDKEFRVIETHHDPFSYVAADTDVDFTLSDGSQPRRVSALRVSGDYFRVLGVQPALGRSFTPDEDRAGGPNVAILSDALWRSQFGADPRILGKTILLDGAPFAVVGVTPAGFASITNPDTDLWTTISQVATTIGSGGNYDVICRLQSGITREQAQSYVTALSAALPGNGISNRAVAGVGVFPYRYAITSDSRPAMLLLLGAMGLVLLIASANVANLLIARATTRDREVAIRVSLGAGRSRVFRQLLTESIMLALIGGALGLLVAYWGLAALLSLTPANLPRAHEISLDVWALGFTLLLSLVTGVLCGLAPALQASKIDLNATLKDGGRGSAGSRHRGVRSVLVIGEIALSLVLLAGASLLMKSLSNLLAVDPGFDPRTVLSLQIWTTTPKYSSMAAVANIYRDVTARIESIPGVEGAGVIAAGLPLERGGNNGVKVAGEPGRPWHSMDYREVTPSYFPTMGIPLLAGRFPSEGDTKNAANVVIINQALARRFFHGRNPIGEELIESHISREIVGVVGDVRSHLNEPARPTIFIPLAQADAGTDRLFQAWFPTTIVVRTDRAPLSFSRSIQDAVRSADPDLPLGRVRSMEQVLSTSIAFQTFLTTLMSVFAGLAILLAAVGIYGVIAQFVVQRTREIGIRMALGAQPRDVLGEVLGWGVRMALAGLGAGLAASIALTQLLKEQLYGVSATDPPILAAAVIALALVALAACYIPARRATKVDPMVALHYE